MEYLALKKRAVGCVRKCKKFAETFGYADSCMTLSKVKRVLAEGKLVVMTIGEARTGKSSLIGAYLDDRELFPVDVDVTTCLITMAAYAETEKVTVILSDDDGQEYSQTITRAQIPDYAKEQNNPNGQKRAKMILIETPNEVLKDGVVFMDSPGIGSLNPLHSQLTYQFLPRADVVLYVSDATSQISESELQFLKSVHRSCENILFVLTKKDLQLDCSELIERNRTAIAKWVGIPEKEQIHVPVSSNMLMAYKQTNEQEFLEESNFTNFDHAVWNLISARRPRITILPRLIETENEMERINQSIIVEETAYGDDLQSIKELEETLEELVNRRKGLLDNKSAWEDDIKNSVLDMTNKLSDMMAEYEEEALGHIDTCLTQDEYIKHPEKLKTEIIGKTEQHIRLMEEHMEDTMNDIQADFEEASGLDLVLSYNKAGFGKGNGDKIVFHKRSKYEQVVQSGKKVRAHSFGVAAVTGVVGSIVGGVAGFFLGGGPVGAMVGASLGSSLAGSVGGAVGAGAGVVEVLRKGTAYEPEAVRKQLIGYVKKNVTNWTKTQKKFVTDTTNQMKKTIREAVHESVEELKDNIQILRQRSKTSGEDLKKAAKRVTAMRAEYDELIKELRQLMQDCTAVAEDAL